MTNISMTLLEYLRKHGLDRDANFLQEGVRLLSELIMDLEVSEQIRAGRYERNTEPTCAAQCQTGHSRLRRGRQREGIPLQNM